MKTTKLIIVAAMLLTCVAQLSIANAAEVRSISREIVQKVNGKPLLKVRVSCAEVEQPRLIVQAKRSGPWCSADLPTACAKQKLKAAKKVCGTHFARTLNEYLDSKTSEPETNMVEAEVEQGRDIEIATVEVPLSDSEGEDIAEDELEKRYEEFVESIDF